MGGREHQTLQGSPKAGLLLCTGEKAPGVGTLSFKGGSVVI